MPPNVAVPFPLSVKVTPVGKVPVSVKVDAGTPVVITVNEPAVSTLNVVLLALVITGGAETINMPVFCAVPDWQVPPPFAAITVNV